MNSSEVIIGLLRILAEPITQWNGSNQVLTSSIKRIGWDISAISDIDLHEVQSTLEDAQEIFTQILESYASPLESFDEAHSLLSRTKEFFRKLEALSQLFQTESSKHTEELGLLPVSTLQSSLPRSIKDNSPILSSFLDIFDIFKTVSESDAQAIQDESGRIVYSPTSYRTLSIQNLKLLLKSPIQLLMNSGRIPQSLSNSNEALVLSDYLFPRISKLLSTLGVEVYYGIGQESLSSSGTLGDSIYPRLLTLKYLLPDLIGSILVSLAILSSTEGGPGVAIKFSGSSSVQYSIGNWLFTLSCNLPSTTVAVTSSQVFVAEPQSSSELTSELSVVWNDSSEGQLTVGSPSASHAKLVNPKVRAFSEFPLAIEEVSLIDLGLEFSLEQAILAIHPSETNTFLKAVLPEDGLTIPFDFGIGWSKQRGLYFSGGASLDATLPVDINIVDVLKVPVIYLAIHPEDGGIFLEASAAATVTLGPVLAQIERMGLFVDIGFPDDATGNLGIIDLDLGIKPPSGVGLEIDSGEMTGGGYITLDTTSGDYSGILQLQFHDYAIQAVGILNTNIANQPDAYSLLMMITSSIPPIQLGFGITLNAIGGLVGIHRAVDRQALQDGIRNKTLDSILFPENVVENAAKIISDLEAVCPPTPDRYVVAPMVELGWGTPSIVTAQVAILFEFPEPIRLSLLGQLRMALPGNEAPLVLIKLDVVGLLDLERSTAEVDASLYDSKIHKFVLDGDMALRANFGTSPSFALAAGGFHPASTVPVGFPTLRPLSVTLSDTEEVKIRMQSYVALTSNTAQFGSELDIQVDQWGVQLEGHLGFDAIFQFNPLQFHADMDGYFAIAYLGFDIASAYLEVRLSGPNAWYLNGKVTFECCGEGISVDFDATTGTPKAEQAPTSVDAVELVLDALTDQRNWMALPRQDQLFTMREDTTDTSTLLLHPLNDGLAAKQNVAPLNLHLDFIGTSPVKGTSDRVIIEKITIGNQSYVPGQSEVSLKTEQFAPAQYFVMSDADKLASPGFQEMDAGFSYSAHEISYGGFDEESPLPEVMVEPSYETVVIDKGKNTKRLLAGAYRQSFDRQKRLVKASASALSARQNTGYRTHLPRWERIEMRRSTYVLVDRESRETVAVSHPGYNSSGASHQAATRTMQMCYHEDNMPPGSLEVVPMHEAVMLEPPPGEGPPPPQ